MVVSILVWPSDSLEIMLNVFMMFLLCWPSDPGWITLKSGAY